MTSLISRFCRALRRGVQDDPNHMNRVADLSDTGFTAQAHCSACGRKRWGIMRLSSQGSGLAAFRCGAQGQRHVTIFAVTEKQTRRHGLRPSFRHLSFREHLELGARVRSTQLADRIRRERAA